MNRGKTPRRSLNLCSSGKFLEIIVAIVRAGFRKIRRPGLSGTCISGTKLLGSCLEDVAGQRVPCNFVGSRRLSPMGSDIKILCLGGWVLGRATTTLTCLSVSFASFGDNPRQCSVSPLFRLRFRCFPFSFPLFPLLFNIFFFYSLMEVTFMRVWCACAKTRETKMNERGWTFDPCVATVNDAPARLLRKGICKSNLRLAFSSSL